jgi:hypothetical protein
MTRCRIPSVEIADPKLATGTISQGAVRLATAGPDLAAAGGGVAACVPADVGTSTRGYLVRIHGT